MPVIERDISLGVPAELVFRYLQDPSHLTVFCPYIIDISDVQHPSPGNATFAWEYKMLDVHLLGQAEANELKHNRELKMRFWGGVQGHIVWQLHSTNDETLLKVELDYTLPTPLLKKHSENTLLHQNERDVERMLTNLKAALNTHYPQTFRQ